MDSLERKDKWRSELKLFQRIYDDRVSSIKKIILEIFTQNDILKQLNDAKETSDYVKDFLRESIQDVFTREEELHKSNMFLKTFPNKIQNVIRENSELKRDLKSFSIHSQKQINDHERLSKKLKKVKGIEKYSLKEKKKDQERIHHLTKSIHRIKEKYEKVKIEKEEVHNRSIQERTDIAQMIQKMKHRITKLKNEKENNRKIRHQFEEMKIEVVTLKDKLDHYKEKANQKKKKGKRTKRKSRRKKSRKRSVDSSDDDTSESESSEEDEYEEKEPKKRKTKEEKNIEKLIHAITSKVNPNPNKPTSKRKKSEESATTNLHVALKDTLSKLTGDFISKEDYEEILETQYVPKETHLNALREQQGQHLNDKKTMLERIAVDNKSEIKEFERRKNEEFQSTLDILKSEVSNLEKSFRKEKEKVRKLKDRYEVKELRYQEQLKKTDNALNDCRKYQDKFTQECEKRVNSDSHAAEQKKITKEIKKRLTKLEEEKVKLGEFVKKTETQNKKLQILVTKQAKELKQGQVGANRTFEKERQKLREMQRRKKEMQKKIETSEKRARTLVGKLDSEKRLKTHFERLYREIKLDYERLKKSNHQDDRKAVNTKLIELKLVSDELKEEKARARQAQQDLQASQTEQVSLRKVAEMAKEKFEKCVKERDRLIRAVQYIIQREAEEGKKHKKLMKSRMNTSFSSDASSLSFGEEEVDELHKILDSSGTSSSNDSTPPRSKKGSSVVRYKKPKDIKQLTLKLEETVHRIKGTYSRSVLRLTSDLDYKKKSLQHHKLYQQNHFVLVRKEMMKLKEDHETLKREVTDTLGRDMLEYTQSVLEKISRFVNREKLSQTDTLIKLQKEHHLEQNELMKEYKEKMRLQVRKYQLEIEKNKKNISILKDKESRSEGYRMKFNDLKQLFEILKSYFPKLEDEILGVSNKQQKTTKNSERKHKMFNQIKMVIKERLSASNVNEEKLLSSLREEQRKVEELEKSKSKLKEKVKDLIRDTQRLQSKYDSEIQTLRDQVGQLQQAYKLQEMESSRSREDVMEQQHERLQKMKSKYHQEIDNLRSRLNKQYSHDVSNLQSERDNISNQLGKVKSQLGSALSRIEEKKKTLLSSGGMGDQHHDDVRKRLLAMERENKKLRMKGERKDLEIKQLSGLLQKTLNRTSAVIKKSDIEKENL